MGLKTTNYRVETLGIDLAEAYARLSKIEIDLDGTAVGTFEIQTDRDAIGKKKMLEYRQVRCSIDKELPVHSQLYEEAKKRMFEGWEDDIVDVISTEEGEENAD